MDERYRCIQADNQLTRYPKMGDTANTQNGELLIMTPIRRDDTPLLSAYVTQNKVLSGVKAKLLYSLVVRQIQASFTY